MMQATLQPTGSRPRVYQVTSYGADPTGKVDSTEALLKAIADAFNGPSEGFLMKGITNLGGAHINLQGGNYLISKPLRLPAAGAGNLMVRPPPTKISEFLIEIQSMSLLACLFYLCESAIIHFAKVIIRVTQVAGQASKIGTSESTFCTTPACDRSIFYF
jgi:hypothetical protein